MNILLIGGAISALACVMPSFLKEWSGWKECLEDEKQDYRDKYVG